MSLRDQIVQLLAEYGWGITDTHHYGSHYHTAMGIGDLLLTFTLAMHHQVPLPIIFNLSFFDNHFLSHNNRQIWFSDPLNALRFRFDLLQNLLKSNAIPMHWVMFTFDDGSNDLNQHLDTIHHFLHPSHLRLNIDLPSSNEMQFQKDDYVIFHTKCRFHHVYDYHHFKNMLIQYLYHYQTSKTIIILGERYMPPTTEAIHHGITTIYQELRILTLKNHVVDLTVENIYNHLDFKSFCLDVNLIRNAHQNILFGFGGQVTTCLTLSPQNTFIFNDQMGSILNPDRFLYYLYWNDLSLFFRALSTPNRIRFLGDQNTSCIIMQNDGNLVLYDKNDHPCWASHTCRNVGHYDLIAQDDGNLVIYNAEWHPIWASHTAGVGIGPYRYTFQCETREFKILDSNDTVIYAFS